MTIRYDIHTTADFLLYVAEGQITAEEYFRTYRAVFQDPRWHYGMKVLIDVCQCEIDFTPADFKKAVELMRENRKAGHEPDHLAVLTPTTIFSHAVNTIKLLSDEMPVYLQVLHNFSDSVRWLGLGDQEEELNRFWQALKHQSQ